MSVGDAHAHASTWGSEEGWREQYADVIEQAGDMVGAAGAAVGGYLRHNPLVGAVLAAALVGGLVGWVLANRGTRPVRKGEAWVERQKEASSRRARQVSKTTATAIGPLVMHVLKNPFLRGMIIRGVMRSLRKARGEDRRPRFGFRR